MATDCHALLLEAVSLPFMAVSVVTRGMEQSPGIGGGPVGLGS